jgi:hypothetical protein
VGFAPAELASELGTWLLLPQAPKKSNPTLPTTINPNFSDFIFFTPPNTKFKNFSKSWQTKTLRN